MIIEGPTNTNDTIEKMREKLDKLISKHGLKSPIVQEYSSELDKEIYKSMGEKYSNLVNKKV